MVELAGRLSELVRFERRVDVRGAAGDRADAWQPVCRRWARIEPADRSLLSALLADTRHSARRFRVTLRAGLPLDLDMRMQWRGQALKLTGIEVDPALPGLVMLWVEDFAG
jgi:head-tail adaptor